MSQLEKSDRGSIWTNAKARSAFTQIAAVLLFLLLFYEVVTNTISNLARMNQDLGYSFLSKTAGFDIVQSLVTFSSASTYLRALLVGFLNTLLISALCIVTATVIGFGIGVMRLSKNRLASGVATLYIELFRNIPVLLQIFVWYSLVILQILPTPKEALSVLDIAYLSNRGAMLPKPVFGDGAISGLVGLVIAIAAVTQLVFWARRRQNATGKTFPVAWASAGLLALLPLSGLALASFPVTFDVPTRTAFNFSGGLLVAPEMMALFLALSIYFATYIAEAVRAGVQAVSHGQTEAASSLGLSRGKTLRKVVIPQAMRVIVPPLISIYLGITKTSSLGVAIGYPDLIAVGGTVLNQTGKAIEIVSVWMVIYLSISLSMSALMNWFNSRMKLVER